MQSLLGLVTLALSLGVSFAFVGGMFHPDREVTLDAPFAFAMFKNLWGRLASGVEYGTGNAPPEAYRDDRPINELVAEQAQAIAESAEGGALREKLEAAQERIREAERTLEAEGTRKPDAPATEKPDSEEREEQSEAPRPAAGLADVRCPEGDRAPRFVPRTLANSAIAEKPTLKELEEILGSPACEIDGTSVWNLGPRERLLARAGEGDDSPAQIAKRRDDAR